MAEAGFPFCLSCEGIFLAPTAARNLDAKREYGGADAIVLELSDEASRIRRYAVPREVDLKDTKVRRCAEERQSAV